MNGKILTLIVALSVSAGTASAANKVSPADARKLALARVPGTVVHEKLKHEKKKKGHDHYNIKIKPRDHAKADTLKKVEVDAETGQILEVKDVKSKSYD
ncbi:MAG TPA: PepSY domain-containing protein [Kofleriaceae bacterium]|nr:PepSY domain-containing protein [Kofleriaceae bacterium]